MIMALSQFGRIITQAQWGYYKEIVSIDLDMNLISQDNTDYL